MIISIYDNRDLQCNLSTSDFTGIIILGQDRQVQDYTDFNYYKLRSKMPHNYAGIDRDLRQGSGLDNGQLRQAFIFIIAFKMENFARSVFSWYS